MKRVFLLFVLFFLCTIIRAQYTQTLPLNYTDFFRADAVSDGGAALESGEYAEGATQTAEIFAPDQWNLTGKAGSRGLTNPVIEDNTLSWGSYIDNTKGKAIVYDGTTDGTRVSVYSLKRNNDYSSANGSKTYYLTALINFTKVSSSGGADFISFDGNFTSTTARGRVCVKKGVSGSSNNFHLGMEYANTPTADGTTWSAELTGGETHLVILKLTPNTDKNTDDIESAELFLDPDLTKSEAENVIDGKRIVSATGKGLGAIRGINIVQKKNVTGKVGGLRFSDNWADATMMESAVEKVATKFDDGTWGVMPSPSESYTSGNYPSYTLNGLEFSAAGLQETSNKTWTTNGVVLKNRICVDKAGNKGMITLPTVANISHINVYAVPGGNNRDIKLQMCTDGTNEWTDVDTYTCTTKNECYFFSTTLNRTDATKLRLVNTASGGVYIWKIETFPIVELGRIVTNFNDGTWGEAASKYTSGSFPSSVVNGFELSAAGLQTGSIDYLPTYERLSTRISMDKGSNGGMITLPAVTSVARIDVYANSGSADRYIKLQKYNYSNDVWEDLESWYCETTDCYRFSKTLDSDVPTRLRIANADGSTKYIYKVVTYSSSPTQLTAPEALEATNVVAHSFAAKWNPVADASGYRIVVFNSDGTRKTANEITGGNAFQFNVSDLDAETDYTYKVAAVGNNESFVDSYLSGAIAVTTATEIADSYTRAVTDGNYGTICLPKASANLSSAGAVFYEVAGKIMEGGKLKQVVFDEVTELAAGVPYVFQATASELNIPLTGDAVADPDNSSSNGLVGSFTVTKVSSSVNKYILSNNLLYCTKGHEYYVGENRAYFDISSMSEFSGESPAPGRRRAYMTTEENQTATSIDNTPATNKATKQMIDGKIIIIRNGEKFDLTGQRL